MNRVKEKGKTLFLSSKFEVETDPDPREQVRKVKFLQINAIYLSNNPSVNLGGHNLHDLSSEE